MKRIKYTNTGITPLCIVALSNKTHYIYDRTVDDGLSISIKTLRNHSKKVSAKCEVIFEDKNLCINKNKDYILSFISNYYLKTILYTKNNKLHNKLFSFDFLHDYPSKELTNDIMDLHLYIVKCANDKMIKAGVIK